MTGAPYLLENQTLPLWSERILVALPEDHPLATRDVVLWTDLLSECTMHTRAHQYSGNRFAELAHQRVVFCTYYQSAESSGLAQNRSAIQWLYRRHMQHTEIDAASALAASSARMVRRPEEMITTSLPSRIT